MLMMHCPQCGSELVATATHCNRCGRAAGGTNSWATPKLPNLAQAVEQFRDEVKSTPLPQPVRPEPAAKQPLTITAQWSTVSAEAAVPTTPMPGFFPTNSPSGWGGGLPSTPTPAPQTPPPATIFREGESSLNVEALPPDHWSRQAQRPAPAPEPPPVPAAPAHFVAPPAAAAPELPDLRDLAVAVEEKPRQMSPLIRVAAVVIAVGVGIGISTYFFAHSAEGKAAPAAAPKPDKLQDLEVSGFRLKRLDARSVQVKFLVINHGAATAGRVKLAITLRAGHDNTYTFDSQIPAVAPGELTEVTTKITAPQTLDESSDWQKLKPEYHAAE